MQLAGAFGDYRQYERVHNAYRGARENQALVSVRRLGSQGTYPNRELASGRGAYLIRHATPYLVSMISTRDERDWGGFSELSDWTRHETRVATALSCTRWGRFTIFLGEMRRELPLPCLEHVPRPERMGVAVEIAALLSAAAFDNAGPPYFGPPVARNPVAFRDFAPFQLRARRFASKFLVSHMLLLRTATHYLRATMLWATPGMTEDALARLLFALEGCLLLLQEVHGGRSDRLERKFLREIFTHTYQRGESLYDFIEEGTGWGGTRARIVHPQLAITEGWTPYLSADDYFEYAGIIRALMMYLITGTSFGEHELTER